MNIPIITDITISTPALVFPAITILILTYSNRFTTLSNRIREFVRKEGQRNPQIDVFHKRIGYVKDMLFFGVSGLGLAVVSMLALMFDFKVIGWYSLAIALISIIYSLFKAALDVSLSMKALDIELNDKCG
jgi:hypothetical protein